jgi:putative hydrolase of the HAD superfamily
VSLPYSEIDTVFFDVGNTLLSIDFDWISAELDALGVGAEPATLRRAEARARPRLSGAIAERGHKEDEGTFTIYLDLVLEELANGIGVEDQPAFDAPRRRELVARLTPILRIPGRADLLWRWIIPGVPEALQAMRDAGLRLAVVSNADGTVDASLTARGLRDHFDVVADSHVVGHQKPDPRIFAHALEACGADPARTLHVGDLYAADVVGARAVGVHPVLLDPFEDWGELDCVRLPDIGSLGRRLIEVRRPGEAR